MQLDIVEFISKHLKVLEKYSDFDDILYGYSKCIDSQVGPVTWYDSDGNYTLYHSGLDDIDCGIETLPRAGQLFLFRNGYTYMSSDIIPRLRELEHVFFITPESIALFDTIDKLNLLEVIPAESKTIEHIDEEIRLCFEVFDRMSLLNPTNMVTLELAGIDCSID